jgi:hypothetical protein
MQDGKPRSLPEIREALPHINAKTVSSAVTRLWREQKVLLASELKHIVSLKELPNQRFKWSKQKLRWYIYNNNNGEPISAKVSYVVFDKKLGRNVEVQENLVFKTAEETKDSQRTGSTAKVFEILKRSRIAMFPEDFERYGINIKQAVSALHTLYVSKRVQRIGWINPSNGEESPFDKGWLYHINSKQVEKRLAKKDLLSKQKQEIYEFILLRSNVQRSFTRARAIAKRFGFYRSNKVYAIVDEINSVYRDIEKVEINGETFYYIKGVLSKKEVDLQKEFWKSFGQKRSSFHGLLGRAHEAFVQLGLDQMWKNNDLKMVDYHWEFSIDRKGRKQYNRFYPRATEPSRKYEFDRVLHCWISPFSHKGNSEIVLVFEMKYRGRLNVEHWKRFVRKLADTWQFGYEAKMRDIQGNRVIVRLVKHNVIPVMVVPWAGKNEIEVRMGKELRKVNFAEYVTMQGGIVLFTGEFESYIREKTGKQVNFIKMFRSWWAEKRAQKIETAHEEEFTKLLVNFLFERGSNFKVQGVPVCCTANSKKTADFRKRTVKQT